jgi:hypothetical protein
MMVLPKATRLRAALRQRGVGLPSSPAISAIATCRSEPVARQNTQAIKMRFQPSKIIRIEIKSDKIAQAAVDRVEVLADAIRRDMVGAVLLRLRAAERSAQWRRVHFSTSFPGRLAR